MEPALPNGARGAADGEEGPLGLSMIASASIANFAENPTDPDPSVNFAENYLERTGASEGRPRSAPVHARDI